MNKNNKQQSSLYMLFDNKKKVETKLVRMTPDLAKKYLENNTSNRPLRANGVTYIAGIIERGEWEVTHQGVAIDENGLFIDGQHRLHGIIKAGIAVDILVTTGISKKSYGVIDSQLPRNLSDKSQINKKAIEVLSFLMNSFESIPRPTAQQAIDRYIFLEPLILAQQHRCSANVRILSSAGFRAAAVINMIGSKDATFTLEAYYNLVSGNVTNLSRSGESLMKQIIKGTLIRDNIGSRISGNQAQKSVFTKAYFIFNEKNKNKTLLSIKDSSALLEEAKNKYLNFINQSA
jgi:hypothetical protein